VETYLTIEELAHYLKVAEQTIRRWVLNREIPFCKIKKVIRFRLSEIEKWVDKGGASSVAKSDKDTSGDLFEETETAEAVGTNEKARGEA
jgi:PTS system nitrogen regulatory IIA component